MTGSLINKVHMKTLAVLIVIIFAAVFTSSCAGAGTAGAPAGQFSRNDWDVCGFGPYAVDEDFENKFDMQPLPFWDAEDSCGHGYEFSEGVVGFSSSWITGAQYKRLYTSGGFSILITDMSSGVELPRGLHKGSSMEQVKNAFGLGEANEQGIYYGDGKNAPYAMIVDPGFGTKTLTLAVPAGETNDERYNYTCILNLVFDDKDSLTEYCYMSQYKYRILPGLPESEQVSEVRLYSTGKEEPERVLKFEDAIDVLACIQDAGRTTVEEKVAPTHRIEIVSGGEVYTLKYGGGLIEAPDGRVYEIWDIDEEALFGSLPEMRPYEGAYMRDEHDKAIKLSAQQEEEIKRIIGSMVPCSEIVSSWGQCWIFLDSGDGYECYTYPFEAPYLTFGGKAYKISEEDSDIIWEIYNEVYGSESDPIPEAPSPSPKVSSTPRTGVSSTPRTGVSSTPRTEESLASASSEEPLLPGMPAPSEVTDVLIWRIGEQGITYKWKPSEAAELFAILQAGNDKPLESELVSPKYIILIRGGNRGYNYEITVGSNGIRALNGEGYQVVYDVIFPDHAAGKYLPESAWDPEDVYIAPPKGGFGEGCIHDPYNLVKNLINVKDFTKEQFSAVSGAVDGMTPCADASPAGKFFAFSLAFETKKNTEQWFTYEYYIGTNYVSYEVQGLVDKSLFTISDEDAQTLTEIYTEIYSKCYSELLGE